MKQYFGKLSKGRSFSFILTAIALTTFALPSAASSAWDIVGLKLGMTVEEAQAVLAAHSPDAVVTEDMLVFTFSDGARQQETPAFLATILASTSIPNTSFDRELIKLEFSPPPLEQRLIGIRREISTYNNPPPRERMLASLTQKYGEPLFYKTYNMGTSGVAGWAEAGKPICGQRGNVSDGNITMPPAAQSPNELNKYYQWQQRQLAPADLSTCSAVFTANLTVQHGGDSLVQTVLEMNAPGIMVPTLEATGKWLSELETAARAERLNSGVLPDL